MRIGICDDNIDEAKLIEEVCKATYDAECILLELEQLMTIIPFY